MTRHLPSPYLLPALSSPLPSPPLPDIAPAPELPGHAIAGSRILRSARRPLVGGRILRAAAAAVAHTVGMPPRHVGGSRLAGGAVLAPGVETGVWTGGWRGMWKGVWMGGWLVE